MPTNQADDRSTRPNARDGMPRALPSHFGFHARAHVHARRFHALALHRFHVSLHRILGVGSLGRILWVLDHARPCRRRHRSRSRRCAVEKDPRERPCQAESADPRPGSVPVAVDSCCIPSFKARRSAREGEVPSDEACRFRHARNASGWDRNEPASTTMPSALAPIAGHILRSRFRVARDAVAVNYR